MRNETLAARLALSLCVAGTAEAKSNGGPRSLLGRIPRIIVLCFLLTWTGLAGAQTTILTEGFEGAFPGSWSVGDSNPSGTTAYWDDVGWDFGGEGAHGGSWKGYCAGIGYGGTASSPTYRDYMTAYMSHSINLSGYSSAQLTFWYKIPSIESGTDRARVYIGSTVVWERSAVTSSWTQVSISLSSYVGGTRTLKFEFYSDYSVTGEGWYLDDIAVTASGLPTVDLAMRNLSVTRPTDASARTFTACSFGIYNYGPALSSGNLLVEYYLSSDTTFGNSDDRKIGDTGFSGVSIGAGSTYNVPLSSTGLSNMVRDWTAVLVGAGNYYVYAKVSCTNATETDPSDNYGRTSSTFLYQPVPPVDLAMRNLSVTRPTDASARTFTACSFGIYNYGPALSSGNLLVEYYLSSDTTFGNSDDRKIGDTGFSGVSIGAGSTYNVPLSSTGLSNMVRDWTAVLVGAGNYYVYAKVSCTNATETDPSDNYGRTSSTFLYQHVTAPTRRALLVGINHYDPNYGPGDLPSCVNDANGVRNTLMLGDTLSRWPSANIQTLTDAQATKNAIRAALQNLASQSAAGDLVVFYQSSHGGQNSGTSTYLNTYNADYEDTELGADLALFNSSANVIVVVDACHSGGLFKGEGWPFAQRVRESYRAARGIQLSRMGYPIPMDFGSNIGFMVACNYDETCAAGNPYSVYTKYLLDACTATSADTNTDGEAQFLEIHNYADSHAQLDNPGQDAQSLNDSLLGSLAARTNGHPTQTIQVTWPSAGASWPTGTNGTVTWTCSNFAAPGWVWIYLFKGNVCQGWLKSAPFQNGSNSTTVMLPPDALARTTTQQIAGSDYQIKILWTQNVAVSDFSDYFSVADYRTMRITSPAGGVTWPSGTSRDIIWTVAGNGLPSSGYVWIYLFKGTVCKGWLATKPFQKGSNTKAVVLPPNTPPGTDYRINLLWTQDTAVKCFSQNFTVSAGPTISNITTDASWPSGIAGAVTWTCNSFPSGSRVWIYLFRGSVCKGILGPPYSAPVTNPNGLNTAVVPLPSGLPPGTDYRVNVLWTQDTAVKAFSPSFEVYQGTSGWVLNPQNGHYYRAFTVGMSWTSAKAAAEAMSYSGMQGHLATVTSAQENEWMRTNLSLSIDSRYWIGGRQSPTGQEPAGGWEWITGESWSYTNWGLTQPDDSGGGQDYLLYNHPMGSVGGFWDDNYESTPWGYIVECEP